MIDLGWLLYYSIDKTIYRIIWTGSWLEDGDNTTIR